MGDAMVSMKEAATKLNLSVSTVRRMIGRGELQAVRLGRQVRILPSWIDEQVEDSKIITGERHV